MREYVIRFLWNGATYEERVRANSEDLAMTQITERYPGCRIISILHL